jgi:NAD(P)-dependent dehydrogenase (short-subunit alcohol dehydrogenase family)
MTLSDKIAIVTGGTGALGRAVVPMLLEAGAAVAVPYTRPDALEELRQQTTLDTAVVRGSSEVMGELIDLTDEQAVAAFCDHVQHALGGIDILVNLAGGFGGGKPAHETPWSLWQKQLDVNLKTAVLVSHFVVPHLMQRGGGAIVNVGSRPAVETGVNLSAYAAAKRAVLQLTTTMAEELKAHNITVNAVLPSLIDTPDNRKAMPRADHDAWVKPQDIARVIRFLVGPEARIVSGAHIPVYGRS